MCSSHDPFYRIIKQYRYAIRRPYANGHTGKSSYEHIVSFQFFPRHSGPLNEGNLGLMHLVPLNHRIGEF